MHRKRVSSCTGGSETHSRKGALRFYGGWWFNVNNTLDTKNFATHKPSTLVTRSVTVVMTEDLGLHSYFKGGLPIQFQCCKWVQNASNSHYIVAGIKMNWFLKIIECGE